VGKQPKAQLVKKLHNILLALALFSILENSTAQGPVLFDTPAMPSYGFFDKNCFIKTAYPKGEIQLPQGGVDGMSEERPMNISIPTNRPTWALAIAHAWNYNRNIIQRVDHPKIALWMVIPAEETGWACDCGAEWPADRIPWNTVLKGPAHPDFFHNEWCGTKGGFYNEGCYQMLELAWCTDLSQTWPWRFKPGRFEGSIPGSHFEISALGFAYRSIENHSLLDAAWGIDIWPIIDATKDPNAYEKLIASGWNDWAGGVQQNVSGFAGNGQGFNLYTPAGRAAAIASDNWNLTSNSDRYPEITGWGINALEQNTTSSYYKWTNPVVTSVPGPQQNHVFYGYYNADITWAIVQEYLTTINYFYSEFSPAQWAVITQNVKKVFDKLGGGAAIPFKQLGPVIDEIILNLPKENPVMSTVFNASLPAYNNGERKPIGKLAPASHIENLNENDTICKGQAIILEGVIDGGDGPNVTYTWYKDGSPIGGNTKQLVLSSTVAGQFVYTLKVCNPAPDFGGCFPACCPKTIVVNNCNTCSIVATASTVNTPCQNMHGGKINLSISGTSNYTISYQCATFGSTVSGTSSSITLEDVPNGAYNIVIQDKGNPSCKFNLSAEVGYVTAINEKLTADILSMTKCEAQLKTGLAQDNCECEWSVYFDTPNGAWGDVTFVIITPSNGQGFRLRKDRAKNYLAPTKTTFKLCSGEKIKFEVETQVASGSCLGTVPYNKNPFAVDAWIVNPQGVEVLRVRVPANSVEQYTNVVAFDYLVNCAYTPGSYTYAWNPGAAVGPGAQVAANISTTYTVVATSVANPQCTLSDTVLVPFTCNAPCVTPKAVISGTKAICAGDSALITVALTGEMPFKLKLSNGLTKWTVANISANSYSFYAKNIGTYKVDSVFSSTCDTLGTGAATISFVSALKVNLGRDTALCAGAALELNAGSGFLNYSWSGGGSASTKTVSAAGQYIVDVDNGGACTASDTIVVWTLAKTIIDFGADTLSICPGKNIVLSPLLSGGTPLYSYLWSGLASGTSATFNASTAGYYKVQSTDSKGCTAKDSVYVTVKNNLTLTLNNKSICEGDSLLLNTGYDQVNYTMLWNTGANTQSIKVAAAGIYGVVVDDGNGCKGSDSMLLAWYPKTKVDLGIDQSICPQSTVTLDAGSGFTKYLWSGLDSSQTLLKGPGEYSVVAIDANGCVAKDTIVLNALAAPVLNIGKDIDTCAGPSVVLSAQNVDPSWTLLWNKATAGATLTVDQSGLYFLMATDLQGCEGRDSLLANFRTKPSVNLLNGLDTSYICEGAVLLLDAGAAPLGTSYEWNVKNNFSQSISVSVEGWYQVILHNGACADTDGVYVKESAMPQNVLHNLFLPQKSIYCFVEEGPQVLSADPIDGVKYSYLWSTNEKTSAISVAAAGIYSVTLSKGDCNSKDEVTFYDFCNTSFYLPNTFTPNGDNKNEVFYAVGENVLNFQMLIFDRWGELLYSSTDIHEGWDGKYHGALVQQDVYVVKVNYAQSKTDGSKHLMQRISHLSVVH